MVVRNSWKHLSLSIFIMMTLMIMLFLLITGQTAVDASGSSLASAVLLGETDPVAEVGEELDSATVARQLASDQTASETATYIIVLQDKPLARYSGGVARLPGTSREATGARKLDARAPESINYLAYLADQRTLVIKEISNLLGRELDVSHEYGATIVGFAVELTAAEAAEVRQLASVTFVEEEQISYPQSDSGPIWSGAAGIWGGEWNALSYFATLSGADEVPPITSTVSGEAEFVYNFYTNELDYSVIVANPNGITLTMMHIHSGEAGAIGSPIYDFGIVMTTTGLAETGFVTLSDAEEAELVNRGLYINVHSTANPSGEIRGQIELEGTLGEGIVVGVIDTGIDPWNPSFLATGGDGYVHANPLGSGNYLGVCDPNNAGNDDVVGYDATFPCNDKLIGVWGYTASDASPRDGNGHGSHTAGTAAGNIVFGTTITAPTKVFYNDISGMAPHANIIAYDGCADNFGCHGAALAAAREQAMLDGVDVINYSIGRAVSASNFWQADSEALQWLAIREAGIFVATSNGNSGNHAGTTGHPAELPWITSVGANSHNRAFLTTFVLTDSLNVTRTVQGQAMTAGYGPAEVVFSTSITNTYETRFCAPGAFSPGTFSGEIVICEAGELSRWAKGQAVLDGGAGGLIVAEPEENVGGPGSLVPDPHLLPAAHIDYTSYQLVRQFLITESTGTVMGELSGASIDLNEDHGDIMATFSSRGPNRIEGDLIVPNLTAPGRAIWAPYQQGTGGDGSYSYSVIQGTSMASPHVAGAAALLTALHPNWTPAEMESAMMLTAYDLVRDDDGVTLASPFAQGAGHVIVSLAAESPLVMDVTPAEYKAADPTLDNDFEVRDLNIASFAEDTCIGTCEWQRTVKNVSAETLTWTVSFEAHAPVSITTLVSPTMFSLAPGESQLLNIGIDVGGTGFDEEWRFGALLLDETSGAYPDAHLPFAVLPTAGVFPEKVEIDTETISGTVQITDLLSLEITDLNLNVTGLVEADRHDLLVQPDGWSSPGTPALFFEAITATQFVSIEVPADSFSVIVEIVETNGESGLVRALLFLDEDNNGPDIGDVGDLSDEIFKGTQGSVCYHFHSSSKKERCEIFNPEAGTYYVALLKRAVAGKPADAVDLATAVVPNNGPDEDNLVISGPSEVDAETPYTLTLNYNDPSLQAIGKLYGYFTIGSDSANPGDLATVRVNLSYVGIPEIGIGPNPLTLSRTSSTETLTTTLTLSATGGVLDWNIENGSKGHENVQDGSFEAGNTANPYWSTGSSAPYNILCSQTTCGQSYARTGDWYAWLGGAAPQQSYVRQDVTIKEDEYALLSFQMWPGGHLTSTAVMTVTLDGDVIETYTSADQENFHWYKLQTFDVSDYADGNVHTLAFEYDDPGATFRNFLIDDVSLISSSCLAIDQIEWLDMNLKSGSFSPGSIDLIASFDALDLDAGDHTETLCVNSNDPDTPVIELPVEMTIVAAAPEATADVVQQTSIGGQTVTYTVQLTNTGSAADTFDISLTGNSWPSAASATSLELNAGMTTSFDVAVTIPATATAGSTDSVTVAITSQADDSKSASVSLTTSVKSAKVYRSYLPMIGKN